MARNTYWILLALLAALCIPSSAFATTQDVPFGTAINNTCTVAAATITAVTASAAGTTVAAIYGDTLHKPTENLTANYGETCSFTYVVHNTGNFADTLWVMPVITYYGTDSGFHVMIGDGVDDTKVTTTTTWATGDSIVVGPISEDGIGYFFVHIGVPTAIAGTTAGNGDSINVHFNIGRSYAVTGAYTGDNGVDYAEATANSGSNTSSVDTVTIAGAVFTMAKSGTCTLGGVYSAPVPGATIGYTITYTNTGSGAGSNIVIYDMIDTSVMTFKAFAADTGTWVAQWAPAHQTDFSYGAAGWTAGDPGTPATAKWVRFRNTGTVAAGESRALYFYVTIN